MKIETVLLVDDEADIRKIGELSLSAVGGWKVRIATSGHEAVALALSERPDVILLDVMMPGIDGPGTLALLRADDATKDIPVVFLTAKAQRTDVARYMSLGAAGVITKPFDPMTLPAEVRQRLGLG